jgi:hypothetical protein
MQLLLFLNKFEVTPLFDSLFKLRIAQINRNPPYDN